MRQLKLNNCHCSSYWFPHRATSGACEQRPNQIAAIRLLAKRQSLSQEETDDAIIDWLLTFPPSTTSYFDHDEPLQTLGAHSN